MGWEGWGMRWEGDRRGGRWELEGRGRWWEERDGMGGVRGISTEERDGRRGVGRVQ